MGNTLGSAEAENAPMADGKREPLPRRVYLSLRLKELAADLQAIATERKNLNATLKDHASESTKDVRKMRERRGYLAIRVNILRAEQHALATEKDASPPIETSLSVGGKKKAEAA